MPTHKRRWFLIASLLIVGIPIVIWWTTAAREFILETVHPFRVTKVDSSTGTMGLIHGNRVYVVRCDVHCADFQAGSTYPMKDVGAFVEYDGTGQKITLPIIEEQTTFDTSGGHG